MKQHWRHLNNRIRHKQKRRGQSLVEFALVSMLLFSFLFGILELGRMMFIFSQVASAAQEGARFGSAVPLQVATAAEDSGGAYSPHVPAGNPCSIISQARARVTLLAPTDVDIYVWYDDGDPTHVVTSVPPFNAGEHRVVVQAVYSFHFLTGILDRFIPSGLPIQMISARTILYNEETMPTNPTCPGW